MAFFDELKGKVTQGTKNLADSTRLNAAIVENKRKIEKLYSTLGQAYYAACKDAPAPETAELVAELNGLFEAIEQAENELRQVRGRGKCPNCGTELPANALFCSNCGFKQPQPEPPAQPERRVCPACGSAVSQEARFCRTCGAPLNAPAEAEPIEEPVTEPMSGEEPTPEPAPAEHIPTAEATERE